MDSRDWKPRIMRDLRDFIASTIPIAKTAGVMTSTSLERKFTSSLSEKARQVPQKGRRDLA